MLIISITYINLPYLIQKRKDILILVRNRRAPIYHSQQHYLRESSFPDITLAITNTTRVNILRTLVLGYVFLQQRICIRSLFRIRGKPSNGRTMQNAAIDIVSHYQLLQGLVAYFLPDSTNPQDNHVLRWSVLYFSWRSTFIRIFRWSFQIFHLTKADLMISKE